MGASEATDDVSRPQALDAAAEAWGIEPQYWDIFGRQHFATTEAKGAILASLGVDISTSQALVSQLEERAWRRWARMLPSTVVVEQASGATLGISIPEENASGAATLRLRLEDGTERAFTLRLPELATGDRAAVRGRRYLRKLWPLPGDVALGYHEIEVAAPGLEAVTCRLIVAPSSSYQPEWLENHRAAGMGVTVYGLRSARNWGCGDFTDLRALVDWAAAEAGVDFIALNPLHSIGNRTPYNQSPYLPNSIFYRNPIYLDVEAVEDFRGSTWAQAVLGSPAVQEELKALRAAPFVEYSRVACLKLGILKLVFRSFLRDYRKKTPRALEFQKYVEAEGRPLFRFALHAAIDESMHRKHPDVWNWRSWPPQYQSPDSPEVAEFARRHWRTILFHQYLQWQLEEQMRAAQEHALGRGLRIGLYNDLALATDNFGADLWAHRPLFVAGCRVGSPPDDFSPKGQDWAFPPPNSEQHFEDGYRLFAESIRKNAANGGALRMDHVMRFFRLYWIPAGLPATEGTYVQERFKDVLRVLALESVRNRVLLIGEDLGTVPDYVRENLARFGVLSYRLFYFERDAQRRFRRSGEYPRQALVSVSTHDLPTLAGFWEGRDILARRKAGILPDDDSAADAWRERMSEKQNMLDLLHREELLPSAFPRDVREVPELTGELHNAVIRFLAFTPSELFLINQEDLFKELDQQNLPGTTAEYPNWQRKAVFAIEDLSSDKARTFTAMLRDALSSAGRLRTRGD